MIIPHQNSILEHNPNNQHMINTVEEFDGTIVQFPNDI